MALQCASDTIERAIGLTLSRGGWHKALSKHKEIFGIESRRVPDAWAIQTFPEESEENNTLHWIEIENTNFLSEAKMCDLGWLAFCLDGCGWNLVVWCFDRYGSHYTAFNGMAWYYSLVVPPQVKNTVKAIQTP